MSGSLKKIGIIGAMDVEVDTLIAELKPFEGESVVKSTVLGERTFVEGILDGVNVVVVRCGVGKVNAGMVAQALILKFGVTNIINTGIAGAMASGLKIQDFVVSTSAVYHDFDVQGFGYPVCKIPGMDFVDFPMDDNMIKAAEKAFAEMDHGDHNLIKGKVASGDQFIADKAKKAYIKEICNPACVEMEGAAIAHACYLYKTPCVIIRCMSDMADDTVEKTYEFNESSAAILNASFVRKIVANI